MTRRRFGLLILLLVVVPLGTARGQQDPSSLLERMKALERQNRRILERLQDSERRLEKSEHEKQLLLHEVETLEAKTDALQALEQDTRLEEHVNEITARLDDGWSRATRSGHPLRFYGFLRMDAYYNDSTAGADPILTFWANPEGDGVTKKDDDAFTFETRMVRFGMDFRMGRIGSAEVTGKLETDFANLVLVRESRQTPRIRMAYMNFDWGEFSLRLGQDWDVIAPLNPQVHNELVLWGSGNVGDRRPQIQFSWRPESTGSVDFILEAAVAANGTVDGLDNDGSPNNFRTLDGYDAGHPHGQLRLGLNFDTHVEGARAAFGVWGYLAAIETETSFNGEDRFMPYMIGVDLDLPLTSFLTLRGEAWLGQALSDVRGNVIQSINQSSGEEIWGYGGWVELRFQVADDFLAVVGSSLDNPDNGDVPDGGRNSNFTTYLGLKYDWGGGLANGLDFIYWQTDWKNRKDGDLLRIAAYVQLNF